MAKRVVKTTKEIEPAETGSILITSKFLVTEDIIGQINNKLFDYKAGQVIDLTADEAFILRYKIKEKV
jgi:hypothetical protein